MTSYSLNGWSSRIFIQKESGSKPSVLVKDRKYKHSIPDWLDQMGVEAFGESTWEKEIAALNIPANLIVRVNNNRTNVKKLKET